MTGSVALDVTIGLVFIFLIYSLLASIVEEGIATVCGLRARNLKRAIARMLEYSYDYNDKSFIEKLQIVIFGDEDKTQKEKDNKKKDKLFYKRFYKHPSIKYLASGYLHSKPSYISPSTFSKALIDILKKEADKTLKNSTARKKIENVLERKSSRKKEVLIISEETREHIKSLLDDAQGDLVKFKLLLEQWYDETMNRVSGWYKKYLQLRLIIIGYFIAMIFNVNTLEIAKLLSTDDKIRNQLVQVAISEAPKYKEVIDEMKKAKAKERDSILNTIKTSSDSEKTKEMLKEDASKINKILGFWPPKRVEVVKNVDYPWTRDKEKSLELLDKEGIIKGTFKKNTRIAIAKFPSEYLVKAAKFYRLKINEEDGVCYGKFNWWKYIWNFRNMLGYFITALAISLGAPFWFDLLNKLVRIRSSIQTKTEQTSKKKDNTQQGGSSPLNRVG